MRREQELEIEVARLETENAKLRAMLARIYRITSHGLIHESRAPGKGRPIGSTKVDERVFAKTLYDAYKELPPEKRTRNDVADALHISPRTLRRYLERWQILWPPTNDDTLEAVLDRLRREQQRPPPEGEQNGIHPATVS